MRSAEIVVELRLKGPLGVGDPVVDLVHELPVQQPRQHGQRREHHDDGQRDERRELGADSPQALEHELRPSVAEGPAVGTSF